LTKRSAARLILVDEINLHSTLWLAAVVYRGRYKICFLRRGRLSRQLTLILSFFPGVVNIGPVDFDLTSARSNGGPLWEFAFVVARRAASAAALILEAAPVSFVTLLPIKIDPVRQRSLLRKSLEQNFMFPMFLAVNAGRMESRVDGSDKPIVLAKIGDLAAIANIAQVEGSPNVVFAGYQSLRNSAAALFCWSLIRAFRALISPRRSITPHSEATVAVEYQHGIDGPNPSTNNLWWLRDSNIPDQRVLVFFQRGYAPATDEIVNELTARGCRVRILNKAANATSHFPTRPMQAMDRVDGKMSIRYNIRLLCAARRMPARAWQIQYGLRTLHHSLLWLEFMRDDNVRLITSFAETLMDPISLAADTCDAVHFGFHWSAILPSNAGIRPLNQTYFLWGPAFGEAVRFIDAQCPETLAVVGCSYFEQDAGASEAVDRLRSLGARRVICVLDRSFGATNFFNSEAGEKFFDQVLSWIESNLELGILFKGKDLGEPRIFKYAPDCKERFLKLQQDGRAVHLDGRHSVMEGAAGADLVIAIGFNSAGFVATINGCRTVFWDPTGLVYGHDADWLRKLEWDNDDVVYSQINLLINAADDYFESPASHPRFGDLSSVLDCIDPFRDGRTAGRVSTFVEASLDCFDHGSARDVAIAAGQSALSKFDQPSNKRSRVDRD
jgi:hypothetical protein